MAGSKKKKKDKAKRKGGMSAKRLTAVERIERAGREGSRSNASSPASSAASTASADLVPRATGRAAELIDRAHALGLSVAADAPADRVSRLLEEFELVRDYLSAVWRHATGRDYGLSGCADSRLDRVAAWIFDDGRMIPAVLAAARACRNGSPVTADGKALRYAGGRLREEFAADGLLPRPGLLGRLFGR